MKFEDRKNRGWIWAAIVFYVLLFSAVTALAQVKKPVVSAFRTISIVTEPNAIVWIDDIKYGRTGDDGKLAITIVAPGKHKVRVRADGFAEVTKTLLPIQKGIINLALTKTTDEAELAYQQAEALATSDRDKAVDAYKKAVRMRPGFVEAYIGLARLYSESGRREEAANTIKEIRKIRPRSAEASTIEGRNFKEGGEDEKAIASFKRAIADGGGFQPEANTGLGLIYKERAENAGGSGDYEQESVNYAAATKYFSLAIKQLSGAPDAVVLYQFLGLVYEQQKKYKEAITVYQEFLRFFPDNTESAAFESYIVQLKKQLNDPK